MPVSGPPIPLRKPPGGAVFSDKWADLNAFSQALHLRLGVNGPSEKLSAAQLDSLFERVRSEERRAVKE